MQIKITLISEGGYRPLSTLISCDSWDAFQANKPHYHKQAILCILAKRHMTLWDMRKYGYTAIKSEIYQKEN